MPPTSPLVPAIFAGAVALGGCGPSISAVYEGNIRFEHCYRLDMDPNITASHRQACWDEWMQRYTYGQTRDRLEYARRRVRSLRSGDRAHTPLELDADGGLTASAPPEAPIPTSVHKPPPPTLRPPPAHELPAPTDAGAPDATVTAAPPGSDCIEACRVPWRECRTPCDSDAGQKSWQCRACDADYRRCVQRCLK